MPKKLLTNFLFAFIFSIASITFFTAIYLFLKFFKSLHRLFYPCYLDPYFRDVNLGITDITQKILRVVKDLLKISRTHELYFIL